MLCPAELLAHMQFLFVSVTPAVENPPNVRRRPLYPTELRGHNSVILAQRAAGVNDRRPGKRDNAVGQAGTSLGGEDNQTRAVHQHRPLALRFLHYIYFPHGLRFCALIFLVRII